MVKLYKMRVLVAIALFVLVCSCRHNAKEPFRITSFKSHSGGGFDKGGCDFVTPDNKTPIFITYDTLAYISIDDSLVVLSYRSTGKRGMEHYESKEFEVNVERTGERNDEYDYNALVTIKNRNAGVVTKNVVVRCGL